MSLLGFQRALADMAASHPFCRRVAEDADAALAAYDLTPVERRRLASAAGQRGMVVNCSLYRYNRVTTLAAILPGTLHLLGTDARAMVDELFAQHPPDRNMRREAERFAGVVRAAVADGRLSSSYLREVMDYEIMRYEVAAAPQPGAVSAQLASGDGDGALVPHPLVRVATFTHDPAALLPHLVARRPPPYDDVAEGEFHLLLDGRSGAYRERPLDAHLARALHAATRGEEVGAEERDELVAAGLLVRAPAGAVEMDEAEAAATAL
jgi:hypothetical protein